jgi:hypothetical protein
MFRLTLSQKAWIIGGIMALVFLGANFSFGILGYTTRSPSECKRCHENPYGLWKDNKIHKLSIKCIYCHSNISSSQYAYIPERLSAMVKELDKNCLRCHENFMDEKKLKATILAEWVDNKSGEVIKVFGPWNMKEITCRAKFSCIACHKNISHDRAIYPTNLPRVDYCAACHYHMEKDAFCQVHPGPRLVFIKDGKRTVSPSIR